MSKKISIETIVCIPRNIKYYNIVINDSEKISIKYNELYPYIEKFLKDVNQTKILDKLIKEYSSFIFIISRQEFIELEQDKSNMKSEIFDELIQKSIKEYKNKNKKKNSQVIDKIWDNIDKSGP